MMAAIKGRNECEAIEEMFIWCSKQAFVSRQNGIRAVRSTNVALKFNAINTDGKTFALCILHSDQLIILTHNCFADGSTGPHFIAKRGA
jgi:hypothetical protein